PAEIDLLDDTAMRAEDVDCRHRISLYVFADLPITQVHRPGDLGALEGFCLCWKLYPRPQGVMIERRRTSGDRLHERGIGDAARHRSAMVVAVEIGGEAGGV